MGVIEINKKRKKKVVPESKVIKLPLITTIGISTISIMIAQCINKSIGVILIAMILLLGIYYCCHKSLKTLSLGR